MLRSFQIAKLFGIPLYLHTTFFLLPLWLLLANGGAEPAQLLFLLLVLIGVFACVVLHELGHALMARFFGIGTESITLYPIGGVARLQRMSDKPFEEICIALAGPAVNLVLVGLLTPLVFALVLLSGAPFHPDSILSVGLSGLVFELWAANLMLLLFNLLPCFPMDGGRVLRALLSCWKGQLRATEIAVRVGLAAAFFIACLSVPLQSPMPIVLAVFVLFAGQMELLGLRQRDAQRRAAQLAQPVPEPVEVIIPNPDAAQPNGAFSGVAWDSRYRVWVQWHNGRPVAYWG
ncbi:MAG TPA: site-2 protease family protein [Gemmataceae bacterium]|nr:site-2 protease family protein [Gemmataceae bacterium]